ncbi:Arogenate dehydrogenase 1, chloroplastic, partial [Glycine soja]
RPPAVYPRLLHCPRLHCHYVNVSLFSSLSNGTSSSSCRSLRILRAIDRESEVPAQQLHHVQNQKLKIGIIGFGKFGQFLARTLVRQGHTVLAHSRSDYTHVALELGVTFFEKPHDVCDELRQGHTVLAHSRSDYTHVALELGVTFFENPHDVCDERPDCTHPMFGPQSAKDGWSGFLFVFDKVRIGTDEARTSRCDWCLNIFSSEGCQLVETPCAEHDRQAAGSQFITPTVGRILEKLDFLEPTKIDTIGFESLLNLMDNTVRDSFDLYFGLFLFNKNSRQQLERFHLAFESLQNQLFDHVLDNLKQVLKLEEESHD